MEGHDSWNQHIDVTSISSTSDDHAMLKIDCDSDSDSDSPYGCDSLTLKMKRERKGKSMSPGAREDLRLKINHRERQRMHDLNSAMDALRQGGDVPASPSGGAPPAPSGGPPAPPPPGPPPSVASLVKGKDEDPSEARGALFADLSKGSSVTQGLRKVTDDMKTHKNPSLKLQTPVPYKAKPTPSPKPVRASAPAPAKPPKCGLEGKKWIVEYQDGNRNLTISDTNIKQTVYVYRCQNSTVQVKGKVNSITLDSCKKVGLVFEDTISVVDIVNCQSVQVQVIKKVPTVSIDKTDGCMVYLSKESLETEIVSAKSSEMNILVPQADGEFKEFAVPEQFKTKWNGKSLVTEVSDMSL